MAIPGAASVLQIASAGWLDESVKNEVEAAEQYSEDVETALSRGEGKYLLTKEAYELTDE